MSPAPPPSRDLLDEFLQTTANLAQTHDRQIAVLESSVAAIAKRDEECRHAQGESWERWTKRMTDMEVDMATLKAKLAAYITVAAFAATFAANLLAKLLIK